MTNKEQQNDNFLTMWAVVFVLANSCVMAGIVSGYDKESSIFGIAFGMLIINICILILTAVVSGTSIFGFDEPKKDSPTDPL